MNSNEESSHESIVLGGGCFWCLDAVYRRVNGVIKSESGYSGGDINNPSYEQVSSGSTGHAEVVKLTYDPSKIDLNSILDIFWVIHDPTTKDRQGADFGPQYRSIIFYGNDNQKKIIQESIKNAQKLWPDPIVTELKKLAVFYSAEDYHQNYFNKNPEKSYCQVVVNPKLIKLRQKFSSMLKNP